RKTRCSITPAPRRTTISLDSSRFAAGVCAMRSGGMVNWNRSERIGDGHESTKARKTTHERTHPKKRSVRGGSTLWRFLAAFLLCLCVFVAQRYARADGGLRGGQAGYRHAVGAAAYVVQACVVAELDAFRVAAVFAADAHLQVGSC